MWSTVSCAVYVVRMKVAQACPEAHGNQYPSLPANCWVLSSVVMSICRCGATSELHSPNVAVLGIRSYNWRKVFRSECLSKRLYNSPRIPLALEQMFSIWVVQERSDVISRPRDLKVGVGSNENPFKQNDDGFRFVCRFFLDTNFSLQLASEVK